MKTTLLAVPVLAAFFLLAPNQANADDWSVYWGDDNVRVRVGSGSNHRPGPSTHGSRHTTPGSRYSNHRGKRDHGRCNNTYHHVCRYEYRQVAVVDPGYCSNVWVPGHYEWRSTWCGSSQCQQQVWVPGHYEKKHVPGQTRYVWKRVKVCGCR